MIVVDDFPALDDTEGGFGLRGDPPAAGIDPDRHGMGAVASGERVTLGGRDADFAIPGEISRIVLGRRFRDTVLSVGARFRNHGIGLASEKQGQEERQYEPKRLHAVQR